MSMTTLTTKGKPTFEDFLNLVYDELSKYETWEDVLDHMEYLEVTKGSLLPIGEAMKEAALHHLSRGDIKMPG